MSTVMTRQDRPQIAVPSHRRDFGIRRSTYGLSAALALVTAAATALTFFLPDVLLGSDVMNGSARGTALVALAVGVPVLYLAMRASIVGSARGVLVWFGAVMYLAYNALLLLLATPYNRLFLLYAAMAALALATGIALVAGSDLELLAAQCRDGLRVRVFAVYVWVVVAANALAWLRTVVPTAVSGDRHDFGTGLPIQPLFVQDFAFWLPLLAVGAVWLWRRLPIGYLLVGGALAMWVLEAVTIATDQWFGHRADPGSDVVSTAAVPGFLVVAAVGLAVLVTFLRHVRPAPYDRS